MVRLVEVVLKPGKRACPPLATPAAGPAAWDARPTPATPGWGCRGNYTTAGDASELSRLLCNLKEQAVERLAQLEEMVTTNLFDHTSDEHMEQLRALLLIISSIACIMKTPVLGEDGSLNPEIDVVIKNAQSQQ